MPLPTIPALSRRDVLVKGTALVAGIGTAGIGFTALAADEPAKGKEKDIQTLNTALSIEHGAVGAYQVAADSGLLKQPALNITLLFQSHHKSQRDAINDAIRKLGGDPVVARTSGEYGKELNASNFKTQNDVLEMALKTELGAANAYVTITSSLSSPDLIKLTSRILADQSMHWTALASTLAHPLPANAMFFGS